jgi:cell division protein FtsL
MLRTLNLLLGAAALAGAFGLYALKHDTRQLDLKVQADERRLERLQDDIAALKAERAFLARPERIEAAARRQGMAPVQPGQVITPRDLLAPPSADAARSDP